MSAKVDDDFIVIERHVVGKYEFIGVITKAGAPNDERKFLVAVDGRVLRILYGTLESAMAGIAGTVSASSEHLPPADGGPAFPHLLEKTPNHPDFSYSEGMSLLDWFAGQALPACIASSNVTRASGFVVTIDEVVRKAYQIAAAALQERKR